MRLVSDEPEYKNYIILVNFKPLTKQSKVMITFSKKHKKVGDHIFDPKNCSVPCLIMTKGNKHGQIEDVHPRSVNGVDLFSKYYHRDARIYVDKFVSEVCKLYRKEKQNENNS